VRVKITDDPLGPGPLFVHADDMGSLGQVEDGAWDPRTTLLSPFDPLIYDRERTERLFGFRYRLEMYVPKAQRQHGFFVLPILHGNRLIGRVDPVMDRRSGRLTIQNLFLEPDTELDEAAGAAVQGAITELGRFLGAREVVGTPFDGAVALD